VLDIAAGPFKNCRVAALSSVRLADGPPAIRA
jgi:hypothetical protein